MINDRLNLEEYDYFQQEEIRKGLEKNIDVSVYAKPELPYNIMHQLRKALADGNNLTPYISYGVGVLHELRKAMRSGISLVRYIEEGYDSDQLSAIRHALEKKINIEPYLDISYHGACITQIAIGLEHRIDVTPYAKPTYTWRKMKEIRLGIEQRQDISNYANPLYSYWQMHEIRLGLAEGLDISYYNSLMYTAKEMRKRRLWLTEQKKAQPSSDDMSNICADDIRMSVIIIFTQSLYCFFQLVYGMHDIRTFQLHIAFFVFISRKQEFVTSDTIPDRTPINIHTFVRKSLRILKNDLAFVFLKLNLGICGITNTGLHFVFHTLSRKLKSSAISCDALSSASAEISLSSSSMIDSIQPSFIAKAATSS